MSTLHKAAAAAHHRRRRSPQPRVRREGGGGRASVEARRGVAVCPILADPNKNKNT